MYKELTNVLEPTTFRFVKDSVCSQSIPWYYTDYTARLDQNEHIYNGSYFHMVMNDDKPISQLADVCVVALTTALDKLNINFTKILRIRIGAISGSETTFIHPPHVDTDIKHNVGLFYLDTCNADTHIYDRRYAGNGNHDFSNAKIIDSITSVENKFVTFPGNVVHSSSVPTDIKRRITINYNYSHIIKLIL